MIGELRRGIILLLSVDMPIDVFAEHKAIGARARSRSALPVNY